MHPALFAEANKLPLSLDLKDVSIGQAISCGARSGPSTNVFQISEDEVTSAICRSPIKRISAEGHCLVALQDAQDLRVATVMHFLPLIAFPEMGVPL